MSACEEYGPLISAMIDDELSADERARVDVHLQSCAACRRRAAVFTELGRLAATPAPLPPSDWRNEIEHRAYVRKRKQRLSWATTYVAAAAVLLAMIGTVWHFRGVHTERLAVNPKTAIVQHDQDRPPAKESTLTGPLETLQVVSRQEKRTYNAMRRLMAWDLRALKLELKQMDLAPAQIKQLGRRIDMLIDRVEQAGNHSTASGESI